MTQLLEKKKAFTLLFVLCMAVLPTLAQQNVNAWLLDRFEAARSWRQVDFEAMMDTAMLNKDVDALLKCLVVIEYNKSFGADSTALIMVDWLLENGTNERIKGVVDYLLDTKYKLARMQNRYDEIEEMANYLDRRWQENPDLKKKAEHWHRLAKAGRDIPPVTIRRRSDVTSLELYRQEKNRHLINVRADVGQTKDGRFIIDTGYTSSMMLYRHAAEKIGVRLLPDSTFVVSGRSPDTTYLMQMGVLDSVRIGDITLYHLPVCISDEPVKYEADGFIGTPDLARLEYMELSQDSITFRYPVPEKTDDVNFRMNAGDQGDRCIIMSGLLDAHPFSFLFDTGADWFIFPPRYASRKNGLYANIGGQTLWLENLFGHSFIPYEDSLGIFGSPLLMAFKKICFNFRDSHVDYVPKEDADVMMFRVKDR